MFFNLWSSFTTYRGLEDGLYKYEVKKLNTGKKSGGTRLLASPSFYFYFDAKFLMSKVRLE